MGPTPDPIFIAPRPWHLHPPLRDTPLPCWPADAPCSPPLCEPGAVVPRVRRRAAASPPGTSTLARGRWARGPPPPATSRRRRPSPQISPPPPLAPNPSAARHASSGPQIRSAHADEAKGGRRWRGAARRRRPKLLGSSAAAPRHCSLFPPPHPSRSWCQRCCHPSPPWRRGRRRLLWQRLGGEVGEGSGGGGGGTAWSWKAAVAARSRKAADAAVGAAREGKDAVALTFWTTTARERGGGGSRRRSTRGRG